MPLYVSLPPQRQWLEDFCFSLVLKELFFRSLGSDIGMSHFCRLLQIHTTTRCSGRALLSYDLIGSHPAVYSNAREDSDHVLMFRNGLNIVFVPANCNAYLKDVVRLNAQLCGVILCLFMLNRLACLTHRPGNRRPQVCTLSIP